MNPEGGQWRVVAYETSSGRQPVELFIRSLQPTERAKVARLINLLEEHGPILGMPHSKQLTKQLTELRVRGRIDVRIIYATQDRAIYLLHGFIKKSQQLPQKELRVAEARLQDILA